MRTANPPAFVAAAGRCSRAWRWGIPRRCEHVRRQARQRPRTSQLRRQPAPHPEASPSPRPAAAAGPPPDTAACGAPACPGAAGRWPAPPPGQSHTAWVSQGRRPEAGHTRLHPAAPRQRVQKHAGDAPQRDLGGPHTSQPQPLSSATQRGHSRHCRVSRALGTFSPGCSGGTWSP